VLTPPRKGPSTAYAVVAVVLASMMVFSASTKLTLNPGAVRVIHDVVGVPLCFFAALAACEIAGAMGLVVGIFRPKVGVAAATGLVLYLVCAMVAHFLVRDWTGLQAPVLPFLLASAALTLRLRSMPRAEVGKMG
jgi:hypothetical protein